ncbi:hypothetical protein GCM10027089_58680 [Nocardia thraciensis]
MISWPPRNGGIGHIQESGRITRGGRDRPPLYSGALRDLHDLADNLACGLGAAPGNRGLWRMSILPTPPRPPRPPPSRSTRSPGGDGHGLLHSWGKVPLFLQSGNLGCALSLTGSAYTRGA